MKLKKWELALTAALALTFLGGAALAGEQGELSDKLIRLHVVANSDSPEDQAAKLVARDAVLAEMNALLDGARDRDDALERVSRNLRAAETAARRATGGAARATLGMESFPTREYETFALPAGRYMSLRVVLGDGGGRNWWCVVFPPLCAPGSDGESAIKTLSDGEAALITEDSAGVVVKFKAVELVGRIRALLGI
ncbi:MAG: stage II sporulation protein R [Oscillospiraceae bacterium]|jgi:stage II sporulation protein R|nr:stage II sporulation protein R [Oscillospiraceae bacterium]